MSFFKVEFNIKNIKNLNIPSNKIIQKRFPPHIVSGSLFSFNTSHTVSKIKKACNLSLPTVLRSLTTLENLEIVREITGKGRHKVFIYKEYLDVLSKGIEPFRN